MRPAALAAIEADVVRPEAGGEARREQELGVEARDLEKQRAGALVPVQREVAVELLHAADAVLHRRYGSRASARRCRRLCQHRVGQQHRPNHKNASFQHEQSSRDNSKGLQSRGGIGDQGSAIGQPASSKTASTSAGCRLPAPLPFCLLPSAFCLQGTVIVSPGSAGV